MLWSAKETLIVSPGESLTVVLGPGGFGKGGSEVWQPPHASAAKTSKAKRQEDELNARLRQAVSVPGNCRSSHICLLFCVMQSCLLYKIVDRQAKCDGGSAIRLKMSAAISPALLGSALSIGTKSC